MESKQRIAIVGAGPAGCTCAYFLKDDFNVTLFDSNSPLHTILYTGGGRCNLAYAEYDFKELAKFYPRGEKFLYSVFSQFSTTDTINFFDEMGIETYTQPDLRIFPKSNSAKDVRERFLNKLKACSFKKEKVIEISTSCHAELVLASSQSTLTGQIPKQVRDDNNFLVETDNNTYFFDKVVIAVGGHAGFELAEGLGHKIVSPKPALTGLVTKQDFKPLQGLSLKNVSADIYFNKKKITQISDDLLFTHQGISGPLAYKISSMCARIDYNKSNPLKVKLNFLMAQDYAILKQVQDDVNDCEIDLQGMLNLNPKKDIKNLISEFVPKALAEYILLVNNIESDIKCCDINGKMRDLILKSMLEFEIDVVSPTKEGEVVTSGGVCLDEINPKTMQSKLVEGLYFCGEVIDVDGFCGGFNLQNCWSTGFVAANAIKD